MKRHDFLVSLSREHHHGLVLARRALRWASADADARADAWVIIRATFETELEPHFLDEEDRVLPRLAGVRDDLVARTLEDHRRLRQLAREGRGAGAMSRFGELLAEHIRFEERELFPAIERTISGLATAAARPEATP